MLVSGLFLVLWDLFEFLFNLKVFLPHFKSWYEVLKPAEKMRQVLGILTENSCHQSFAVNYKVIMGDSALKLDVYSDVERILDLNMVKWLQVVVFAG